MKRKSEAELSTRPAKRQRNGTQIHLFDLSDELLLRTLSFLRIESLIRCERVCQKLGKLSRDNLIWRERYFAHFVRQSTRRLPYLKPATLREYATPILHRSSRYTQWIAHSPLVRAGSDTNWKQVFKVQYNWHRGRARTFEMQVGSTPTPVVLAKVYRGCLFTADQEHGLRTWKDGIETCKHVLSRRSDPSALDIECEGGLTRVSLGHIDGFVEIYTIDALGGIHLSADASFGGSPITSVALAWPYLMTMDKSNSIALFKSCCSSNDDDAHLAPAALSLRRTPTTLMAGIAYAFNRFRSGWCLGLQEIRMDLAGSVLKNRTTSSVTTPLRQSFNDQPQFTSRSASTSPFGLHPQLMRAPNSLSYSGCYILATLPDNTLMVYTVTSTAEKLEINVGRRLWGHTSAVSAAEVTSTGKAVSISTNSEEMRYWELEEILSSSSQGKTSTAIKSSHMLNDAINKRGSGLGLAIKEVQREMDFVRRGISFDDEQAVVVGQRDQGQFISCFNFA
ncbi:hypothetical protein LTR05_003346 [Lithohypha guttulata]|uniref:F-box domain-containing protein n=1 Tax=Lithohypha guttulata TaxID=1690604 RepID=A0AAN7T3N1_9EURO|nr:hypothetical protein LTR05_003346 [Lithohypha guttulata]